MALDRRWLRCDMWLFKFGDETIHKSKTPEIIRKDAMLNLLWLCKFEPKTIRKDTMLSLWLLFKFGPETIREIRKSKAQLRWLFKLGNKTIRKDAMLNCGGYLNLETKQYTRCKPHLWRLMMMMMK